MHAEKIFLELLVSKSATELAFIKRCVHSNDVSTEKFRIFEIWVKIGVFVPIFVIVWFMQKRSISSRTRTYITFYQPSVTNVHCIIVTQKYPGKEKSVIMNLINFFKIVVHFYLILDIWFKKILFTYTLLKKVLSLLMIIPKKIDVVITCMCFLTYNIMNISQLLKLKSKIWILTTLLMLQ